MQDCARSNPRPQGAQAKHKTRREGKYSWTTLLIRQGMPGCSTCPTVTSDIPTRRTEHCFTAAGIALATVAHTGHSASHPNNHQATVSAPVDVYICSTAAITMKKGTGCFCLLALALEAGRELPTP